MGAEQAENSEKKDPVVARAEAALSRIDSRKTDRLSDLKQNVDDLKAKITELQAEKDKATGEKTSKGDARALQLGDTIDKLERKVIDIENKMDRVVDRAGERSNDVLDRVDAKADNLESAVKRIEGNDDAADKRDAKRAALEEEIKGYTSIIDDKNASPEARKQAQESRGEAYKKQERISEVDRAETKGKRALEIREFQAKEEAKDREQAEQTLDAELKELPDAEATPKKNAFKGMFSKMADNVKNKLIAMADKPRDPTDALGGTKFTVDKVWANIMYSMSNREITWDQDLSQGRKDALADAGITFVHDEERNVSTIKFGKVPEGSEGVAPGAIAVLQEYFGDTWYLKFKSLKTTDTVADLEKNIAANPTSDDEKNYQRFVVEVKAKMEADHAPADTPVLTWLAENGSEMKNITEPVEGAPDAPSTPTLDVNGQPRDAVVSSEEAVKLAGEWGLTLTSAALLDGNKTLLKLNPGETADISVENGGLKLDKHVEGPDQSYTGATKEAFVQALVEALPKNPITPDADAKALADEWGIDVLARSLSSPMGPSLIELKEGETADLKKVDNNLQLTVHKEGVADRVYSANTYEAFANLLNPALESDTKPAEAPAPAPAQPEVKSEPVAPAEQGEKVEVQSPVLSPDSIKGLSSFPGLKDPKISLETTVDGAVTRVHIDPSQLVLKIDDKEIPNETAVDITHLGTDSTEVKVQDDILTLTVHNSDGTTQIATLSPKTKSEPAPEPVAAARPSPREGEMIPPA